jgi:hypothetical protein
MALICIVVVEHPVAAVLVCVGGWPSRGVGCDVAVLGSGGPPPACPSVI